MHSSSSSYSLQRSLSGLISSFVSPSTRVEASRLQSVQDELRRLGTIKHRTRTAGGGAVHSLNIWSIALSVGPSRSFLSFGRPTPVGPTLDRFCLLPLPLLRARVCSVPLLTLCRQINSALRSQSRRESERGATADDFRCILLSRDPSMSDSNRRWCVSYSPVMTTTTTTETSRNGGILHHEQRFSRINSSA